jgi:hypothetical protein
MRLESPSHVRLGISIAIGLVGPAVAHAESPFIATVGVGAAVGKVTSTSLLPATELGGGLVIDVGYRVHPTFALGVHVAATYMKVTNPTNGFIPLELGVTAHYVIADQIWIAPSIGIEDDNVTTPDGYPRLVDRQRTLAIGVAAGVDLARDHEHRIGLFAAVTHSSYTAGVDRSPAEQSFTALIAGVVYRYW